MKYKNICKAILKKSKEDEKNFRNLLRRWVKIFEDTRVVGWSRDDFLDCMVECKKEVRE